MTSGIYTIKNLKDNKIYIGKSIEIKKRITAHKYRLRNNKHVNTHLQNAWNKYGEDNFEFNIKEICEIKLLSLREKFWIDLYNSNNPEYGYNLIIPDNNTYRHSNETKIKMSKASLGKSKSAKHRRNMVIVRSKPIFQYDLDKILIKEWESATLAAKTLNFNQGNIARVCNGYRSSHKGFIWKYKN